MAEFFKNYLRMQHIFQHILPNILAPKDANRYAADIAMLIQIVMKQLQMTRMVMKTIKMMQSPNLSRKMKREKKMLITLMMLMRTI